MSHFDELSTVRLGYPTPGPVENYPDVMPRVSIAFGPTRRLWFADPAELRAMRDAADEQLTRLEQMLGHRDALSGSASAGHARAALAHDQAGQPLAGTAPAERAAVPDPNPLTRAYGSPYSPSSAAVSGETPDPRSAAR